MDKILVFDKLSSFGEPFVHPAEWILREKTAARVDPSLLSYLATLSDPGVDLVRTVITALSSYEAFGPNRNGDAFFEDHLRRENTYDGGLSVPMFASFEHFARPYRYHINRPDSPHYGKVLKAIYNDGMRRVELVVEVDRRRAPDLCAKLENHEPIGTSMGFRCMKGGDVCSICGNLAPSRREYCEHLKQDMLKVYPDGRQAFAVNPWGKFFDISFVDDPADRTSRAVNVASLPWKSPGQEPAEREPAAQEPVEREPLREKEAAGFFLAPTARSSSFVSLSKTAGQTQADQMAKEADFQEDLRGVFAAKRADILKRIPARIEMRPDLVERFRRAAKGCMLSKEALDRLSAVPVEKVAATCALLGVSLAPQELQYLFFKEDCPLSAGKLYNENIVLSSDPFLEKKSGVEMIAGGARLDDRYFDERVLALLPEDFLVARSHHACLLPAKLAFLNKEAFDPRSQGSSYNPYMPPRAVPASRYQSGGEEARLIVRKAALLAGFVMGARLLMGSQRVPSFLEAHQDRLGVLLMGMAGAGVLAGRRHLDSDRMPIREYMLRRRGESLAGPDREGLRSLMSAPVSFAALSSIKQAASEEHLQWHETGHLEGALVSEIASSSSLGEEIASLARYVVEDAALRLGRFMEEAGKTAAFETESLLRHHDFYGLDDLGAILLLGS